MTHIDTYFRYLYSRDRNTFYFKCDTAL